MTREFIEAGEIIEAIAKKINVAMKLRDPVEAIMVIVETQDIFIEKWVGPRDNNPTGLTLKQEWLKARGD